MGSGDGWTQCALGHRHWGLYGAAGLLVFDADRVILQHRAPWTHEGDTWGIPGGARDGSETVVEAALREAGEEAGLSAADIAPMALYCDDHGGWSYTTVLARPLATLNPIAANAESLAVTWVPAEDVASLTLHSGFARTWPRVNTPPGALHLVVSARLADNAVLAQLQREGISADRLPPGTRAGGLNRLIPSIQVGEELEPQHWGADRQVLLVTDEQALLRLR